MDTSLTSLILHGGPILIILTLFSLASLTVIAVKTVQLLPVTGGRARRAAALARWDAGDPAAANLGIVAAAWERDARAPRVLLTLLNASPRPAHAELVLRAETQHGWRDVERRRVRLGPDEVQAQLFDAH